MLAQIHSGSAVYRHKFDGAGQMQSVYSPTSNSLLSSRKAFTGKFVEVSSAPTTK